ncbi:hypothetical protein D915_005839 [Fasciola hepatica]|uniref:Reverse transcriptase domain-containing protein n=1 Tax=Fasciola hepatica TaxID=6192 RepID=A0A4E0RSJ4_FASHE|nr:hypothetical protein D915_005839 [Fasciola hepatica]
MDRIYLSVRDVEQQLKNLNPYSSMGPDDVYPRIPKECADLLARAYFILFQRCLDSSTFPSSWNAAIITPTFKDRDRHFPSGCRPIGLESIPSKVFESIIKRAMLRRLPTNILSSPFQHGFLPDRSCINNMLTVKDSVT